MPPATCCDGGTPRWTWPANAPGLFGCNGAAFPWRTIRGQECSAYWPAGTAAFHLAAAIADAVRRYVLVTDDRRFEREIGLELLVETARLWRSLGHHDRDGEFHIDGVTGPDEYSALADDNVYTNLMAQRNLSAAADAANRYPEEARRPRRRRRGDGRLARRRRDDAHPVRRAGWGCIRSRTTSPATTSGTSRPPRRTTIRCCCSASYFDLYRKQVVKQADLVLAMHWRGDAFTAEQKARNFAYYERLTVRDSSLSACTQAIIAAEVGHLELAHDYIGEAALMDVRDLAHNTRDGVHLASLAGAWLAVVAGLGGLRDHDEVLAFAPRLPERISRLRFSILWRGLRLQVTAGPGDATYALRNGDGTARMRLRHYDEVLTVATGSPVTRPIPPLPSPIEPVTQPPGRSPRRRTHLSD